MLKAFETLDGRILITNEDLKDILVRAKADGIEVPSIKDVVEGNVRIVEADVYILLEIGVQDIRMDAD